jgi:polar amino acid transport system permease protein
MNTLTDFFRQLNTEHGLNFSVFYDAFEWGTFVDGIGHTFMLAAASMLGSVLLGMGGAFALGSRWARVGVEITPPLVQMYFFHFALGPALSRTLDSPTPVLGNIGWAVISLTLFAGAFNVEIFRAGIEAVPTSMQEAARAMGLSRRQTFMKVTMPLAWRISLPALNNNLINLIKTTTNASAIAVPELLYVASQIWAQNLNTAEMMIVLLVFYLGAIGLFVLAMGVLEKKLAVPGWGTQ